MAKSFASVEWLSQSSHNEDNKKATLSSKDEPSAFHVWDTSMSSLPKIAHVFPYPGTQDKDNEQSTSPKTLDNQIVSTFREMTMEESCSSKDNGQDNASENFVSTNKESCVSQDLPSTTQKSCDDQKEQTTFKEDSAQSGSGSNTESGYDSEVGRSSPPSLVNSGSEEASDISDEEGKVGRRLRTAFTMEQITTLESNFQKQRYLGASERRKLAVKLHLSEVQIKTWFQNRRMKHKREIQEGRQVQFYPGQFYGLYGYQSPPIPSYHYLHHIEQLRAQNPMLDPMSFSYPTLPTVFDSLNTFSPPSAPRTYLPQQPFMPPVVRPKELEFARY